MGVSILNNLGALNAVSALQSSVDAAGVEDGLFSALFGQQLGTQNPLMASLIAENPSVAPDMLKNALQFKNHKNNEVDVVDVLAMLSPDVENVLHSVVAKGELENGLAATGSGAGQSNNVAAHLLHLLSQSGNQVGKNDVLESVKLAGSDPSTQTQTPFTAILNAIADDAAALPKNHAQSLSVQAPVGSSMWAEQLNQQIVWAAKNDWQSAEIRLTPENLGPIKIQMNVVDGKAQINFVSAHSEVRQSISDALPQLKEMLATSGIDLGQANVGSEDKSFFSQEFYAQQQAQKGILEGNASFEETAMALDVAPRVVKNNLSAVDLFA